MSNPDQSNIQLEPTEEVFEGPVCHDDRTNMSLSLSLDMSSVHEDPAESFSSFYSSLPNLSSEWSDQTVTPLEKIQLCKISTNACSSNQPLVVSLSLTINEDFTWKVLY